MTSESELSRIAGYLRKHLHCRDLWLSGGGSGQAAKALVGNDLVGTVNIDKDNNFVLTVPILRKDLRAKD